MVPIARTSSASQPAVSPVVSIPSSPNPPSRSASTRATTKPSGMNSTPIAMNTVARATVHAPGGGEDLAPAAAAREAERGGGAPRRPRSREDGDGQERAEQEHRRHRVVEQLDERLRAGRDGVAEEVRRAGAEDASGRDGVAAGAPAVGPFDRRRPLRLQVRPRRAVEERRLELAPPALERDPRVGAAGGVGVARDRLDVGTELDVRAAGVVAADPGLGRAADVERLRELVRVRAGGGVDDRVRPVDDLELLLAPLGFLGALVRAVADGDRLVARAPRARRRPRRRAGSSPSRPRAGC